MVVNANLTVSNDQLIDFESRNMSNSQIGDIWTSKSRKMRKRSFCEIRSNSKFHFWAQKLFFSKSQSCTILVNQFRIDLSIWILIFEFSKNRATTLILVLLVIVLVSPCLSLHTLTVMLSCGDLYYMHSDKQLLKYDLII